MTVNFVGQMKGIETSVKYRLNKRYISDKFHELGNVYGFCKGTPNVACYSTVKDDHVPRLDFAILIINFKL